MSNWAIKMPSSNSSADAVLAFASLHAQFLKRIEQGLSAHGLSFSEFQVLRALDAAPGQTLRRVDLADAVGLTASGVTRLLQPMEKIGLVSKESHPRDARMSLVKLSEAGAGVYADAATSFVQVAAELTRPLTKKQLESFGQLMSLLR
jgi:DNA-binding MarR family transcriptional regulator